MLDEDLAPFLTKKELIRCMKGRRPMTLTFLRATPGPSFRMSSIYAAAARMARTAMAEEEEEEVPEPEKEVVPAATGFFGQAFSWLTGTSVSSSEASNGEAQANSSLWRKAFVRVKAQNE